MLNPDDPAPAPVSNSQSQPAAAASSGIRTWILALAAGLVAGAIGWSIGEATLVPETGYSDKAKKIEVLPAEIGLRNCTISFGALGAVLGLALGLTGGLVGRSVPRAIVASLSGLLLGGAAGAGLCHVILPVYYDHLRDNDLIYSLMVHCGIWGAAGAAAGLAYAMGTGRWSALLRGLIGGAAGAARGSHLRGGRRAALSPGHDRSPHLGDSGDPAHGAVAGHRHGRRRHCADRGLGRRSEDDRT